MSRLAAGAVFLALLLGGGVAFATQARTEVVPRRTHIGEIVKLRIQVDRAEGDRVTLPRGTSFRPFEVVRRRTSTQVTKNRVRETLEVELMAFETGDLVVPSVELRVYDHEGRVSTIRSDPASVHVASILGNEPEPKRRGNHGPVPVYQKDYTALWVALAVLAFFLQFLLVRWFMKRRAVLRAVPVEVVKRPPWEIALEKLRGIDRSRLVEKGLVKEHYDGVSDAIREYLGALGGFEGLESTTEEVLERISVRCPAGVDFNTVRHFFTECDLVKFAKYSPPSDAPRELFSVALRIVEKARDAQVPQAPPPAAPAPPGSPPPPAAPEARP